MTKKMKVEKMKAAARHTALKENQDVNYSELQECLQATLKPEQQLMNRSPDDMFL